MSFNIGTRVTSTFTGIGVVISEMLPREDGEPDRYQTVDFENPQLGQRPWAIKKLERVGDDDGS
jgi:hypothetical protein